MLDEKKELNFEESMQELDTLVNRIENDNLPLEDMISAYRRGTDLVKKCREKLDAAQMEIKKLEKNGLVSFDNGDTI